MRGAHKLLFPELENAGKETHLKLHPDLRVLWCCYHFYDDVLTDCGGEGGGFRMYTVWISAAFWQLTE